MKKKILIVSLVANLIAGAFVFYSFTPKARNTNDGGGGYLVMRVAYGSYITTDGKNILSNKDDIRQSTANIEKIKQYSRDGAVQLASSINELKAQGYELVSTINYGAGTDFVFLKK